MKEPINNLSDISKMEKPSPSSKSKRWLGIVLAFVAIVIIGSIVSNQNSDTDVKKLQTQIAQYENTIQTLQADNTELQQSLDEANTTLQEKSAKLDEASAQLTEANAKLEELSGLENQQSQIDALNKTVNDLNTQISTKDDTISDLTKQLEDAKSSRSALSNSSKISENSSPTVSYTVYVTKTGGKYHTGSCSYLRKSKISIDKNDAIAQGYTACSRCNP